MQFIILWSAVYQNYRTVSLHNAHCTCSSVHVCKYVCTCVNVLCMCIEYRLKKHSPILLFASDNFLTVNLISLNSRSTACRFGKLKTVFSKVEWKTVLLFPCSKSSIEFSSVDIFSEFVLFWQQDILWDDFSSGDPIFLLLLFLSLLLLEYFFWFIYIYSGYLRNMF